MEYPREVFFLNDANKKIRSREQKLYQLYQTRLGNEASVEHSELNIEDIQNLILKERFFQVSTYYSAGYDVDILRQGFFENSLQVLRDCRTSAEFRALDPSNFEEYCLMLCYISMAILFDLEKPIFERSVVRTISPEPCDRLVDSLIAKYLGREADDDLPIHHAFPYQFLWEATQTWCADPSERVAHFLNNYYDGLKQAPWYDLHVKHSPEFFGYWSFETAAVVKLWEIDDRPFADNMFYPRDMVHERLFMTWEDSERGEKDWDDLEKYRASSPV